MFMALLHPRVNQVVYTARFYVRSGDWFVRSIVHVAVNIILSRIPRCCWKIYGIRVNAMSGAATGLLGFGKVANMLDGGLVHVAKIGLNPCQIQFIDS